MYVSGHRDVDELDASRSRGAPLETLSKRFRVDDGGGGGGGGENHVGFLQHVPHLIHKLCSMQTMQTRSQGGREGGNRVK